MHLAKLLPLVLLFIFVSGCDPTADDDQPMLEENIPVDLILTGEIKEATTGIALEGWIIWVQDSRNLDLTNLFANTTTVQSDGTYRLEIDHFSRNTDTRGMSPEEIIAGKEDYYLFSSISLVPPDFIDPLGSFSLLDCHYAGIDALNRDLFYGVQDLDFSLPEPPVGIRNVNAHTNAAKMEMRIKLASLPTGSNKVSGRFIVKDDGYEIPFYSLSSGSFFTEDQYETSVCVPADRPFTVTLQAIFYDENDPFPRTSDTLTYRDTIQVFNEAEHALIEVTF